MSKKRVWWLTAIYTRAVNLLKGAETNRNEKTGMNASLRCPGEGTGVEESVAEASPRAFRNSETRKPGRDRASEGTGHGFKGQNRKGAASSSVRGSADGVRGTSSCPCPPDVHWVTCATLQQLITRQHQVRTQIGQRWERSHKVTQ